MPRWSCSFHRFPGLPGGGRRPRLLREAAREDLLVMDKWFHVQGHPPRPGSPRQGTPTNNAIQPIRSPTPKPGPRLDRRLCQCQPDRLPPQGVVPATRSSSRRRWRSTARTRNWRGGGGGPPPPAWRPRCAPGAPLEPERQGAARAALLALSQPPELSTDLRDIVERTLV